MRDEEPGGCRQEVGRPQLIWHCRTGATVKRVRDILRAFAPKERAPLATGGQLRLRFLGILAAAMFSLAICNGQGTISTFFATGSSGLAIDAQGNVYLTESSTARVRKISSGTLSTIAGNGNFRYAGDGGPAIDATLTLGTVDL